jgi:hypothetical protein
VPGIGARFGLIRHSHNPEKGNRRLICSRKGAFSGLNSTGFSIAIGSPTNVGQRLDPGTFKAHKKDDLFKARNGLRLPIGRSFFISTGHRVHCHRKYGYIQLF